MTTWTVPIGDAAATIGIDKDHAVVLLLPSGPLTPVEAAQLAQALQEASREAARMKAGERKR